MCELINKVNRSLQVLKEFEPSDGYFLAYSGGKDSDCVRILCELANVKYEIHYNLTSVDAPETVNYIKSISNVFIDKPRYKDGKHKTMWNLIPQKLLPPTRLMRYCCEELKEHNGMGRLVLTGVRSSESHSRFVNGGDIKFITRVRSVEKFLQNNSISYKKTSQSGLVLNFDNSDSHRAVEHCFRTSKTLINPILNWSDSDVWSFLNHYLTCVNPLYSMGFSRVGCIGCPLGGFKSQRFELSLYPKYRDNYIRAFDKMVKQRLSFNKPTQWSDGLDVMLWWLGRDSGQLALDGFDIMEV